jgi:hypothetical protein
LTPHLLQHDAPAIRTLAYESQRKKANMVKGMKRAEPETILMLGYLPPTSTATTRTMCKSERVSHESIETKLTIRRIG